MRFPQYLLLATLAFFLFIPASFAVVGVSASELQAARAIVVPPGSSLEQLEGYGPFSLKDQRDMTGGIRARYEARLSTDPWVDDELPQVQLLVYAYSEQAAAEKAYQEALALRSFSNGEKIIRDQGERFTFFESQQSSPDVFGSLQAEHSSFHILHVNGNLLFQASLYRESGALDSENLEAYSQAMQDSEAIYALLDDALKDMKVGLGILFTPNQSELSARSDKSSLNLNQLYSVPTHGTMSMELYVGEIDGALGTIVDSSGISQAEEGDLYLYINSDGRLFAGIYAPGFDANCRQESGWYRIETENALHSYEWNAIQLHFGVGGFWMSLNDEVTSCRVSQPRSERPLYFGDFPDDSIDESMIGYVEDFSFTFSTTDTGLLWDEVLEEQLFLDLGNEDPDVSTFLFLKNEGIFLGSDGMLYPDELLNRAEMVKVLLRAYEVTLVEGAQTDFWDVPEDAWYKKYLATGERIGMIEGHGDGSFLPGHTLNRAEFYTMLYRIAEHYKLVDDLSDEVPFVDVDEDDWFAESATYAADKGLIDSSYFGPAVSVSRREAARALYHLLK